MFAPGRNSGCAGRGVPGAHIRAVGVSVVGRELEVLGPDPADGHPFGETRGRLYSARLKEWIASDKPTS